MKKISQARYLKSNKEAPPRERWGKVRAAVKDYFQEHKLSITANALCNEVKTYENIGLGYIEATPEMKKSVQTSIEELCTLILRETSR